MDVGTYKMTCEIGIIQVTSSVCFTTKIQKNGNEYILTFLPFSFIIDGLCTYIICTACGAYRSIIQYLLHLTVHKSIRKKLYYGNIYKRYSLPVYLHNRAPIKM